MDTSLELVRSTDGTSWYMPKSPSANDDVSNEAIASLGAYIDAAHSNEETLASSVESLGWPDEAPPPQEANTGPTRGHVWSLGTLALGARGCGGICAVGSAVCVLAALAVVGVQAGVWSTTAAPVHVGPPSPESRPARVAHTAEGAQRHEVLKAESHWATGDTTNPPAGGGSVANAMLLLRQLPIPSPCVLSRAGLSIGLGALGFAVGVPWVPGLTDNVIVGMLSAVLPLYATSPCDDTVAVDSAVVNSTSSWLHPALELFTGKVPLRRSGHSESWQDAARSWYDESEVVNKARAWLLSAQAFVRDKVQNQSPLWPRRDDSWRDAALSWYNLGAQRPALGRQVKYQTDGELNM